MVRYKLKSKRVFHGNIVDIRTNSIILDKIQVTHHEEGRVPIFGYEIVFLEARPMPRPRTKGR